MGVVLDVVYNHLGPSGAYLDRFGPYFAGSNIWGPSINLDGPQSEPVRRFVIDNALHVAARLPRRRAAAGRGARAARRPGHPPAGAAGGRGGGPVGAPGAAAVADRRVRPQRPAHVTAREAGGYGLHAQWCDDIHHCLHTALTGESQGYYADFAAAGLTGLAHVFCRAFLHEGTWSSFRQRNHGAPVDTHRIPGHRFLAYLQNHDQIGNRATGDRLSATLSPGLLACGAALLLSGPFTPMLFMGEEWGARTPWQFFSYFPDEALRDAVRTGRTAEFGEHGWGDAEVPDPNAEATFTDSKLDWAEPAQEPHATLLRVYQELIALRRAWPELSDPWLDKVDVDFDEDARTVVLHRGRLRVAANLGGDAVNVDLRTPVDRILLASEPAEGEETALTLNPESFAIVAVR